MLANLPKQKITKAEKLSTPKDGKKSWGKQCVDAIIESSSFDATNKSKLATYYQAYNGELDSTNYSHILNPYNTTTEKYKRFPAKLRNYNIIKPIIDLMLGEKSKQPFTYQVITTNDDSSNMREMQKKELIKQLYQQKFVNELNALGMDTGMESKDVPEIQEALNVFERSYKDNRAIMGQDALDYLTYNLDLKDELQEGFFDWLISGQVYSYKGVCYDDVEYEIVNPKDFWYYAPDGVKFVEDSDLTCRKFIDTVNGVVDKFREHLTDKDIEKLENPYSPHGIIDNIFTPQKESDLAREVGVYHTTWKSFRKIGFLTYVDELGEINTEIVSEEFKITDPLTQMIEWEWISEIWEGYKLDRDIYIKIQPIEVQRNGVNNISICKQPYNGRVYSNRNADNVSIVQLGIPYQVLYNIFHYKLELSVAKNKDKILLMEINAIPKRHGWDEEKFMYWADANGVAFIDSTAEGKNGERVTFNQFQVLDMTLGQFINQMFELLKLVKEEWEDTLGITRQRKGQTNSSDAVGVTERAVFQSSVITEELFRRYRNFEKAELQGLLDVSKIAWKNGKKGSYLNSDYRQLFLEIDPVYYMESDFDVFVTNSSEDATKLETLRNMAVAFAQNGGRPSTIAEILDAGNFIKIKEKLAEVEKVEQQLAMQQGQAEQAAQQQLEQMRIDDREDQQEHISFENEKDRQLQRELKMMDLSLKSETPVVEDKSVDKEKLSIEREKIRADIEKHNKDISLKEKELNDKKLIESEKRRIDREKIINDLKIAKSRPKPTTKST